MKDLIRVVLVDPDAASRPALQQLLRGVSSIWLSEVCASYKDVAGRANELAGQVTIVILDHDPNHAIELIEGLIRTNPKLIVLPASRSADSGLMLKAFRAGAREFLPLPAEPAELQETLARLLRGRDESELDRAHGPKVITVAGAVGGVGCTSLAVNLAATLAATKERETVLLDLDLMFGAVDACLDLAPDHTLSQVLQNFERLDSTLLKRSITRHASGLYVLPHPAALQEAANVDSEALRRLFGLLRAAFSTVVVDTSKGLQASDFVAFELSDVILLVVQLDLICLRNTARLLALLREYDGLAERVKLVANRSGSWECQISLHKAEETLKMPVSWQVPNSAKPFQESRIKGMPLGEVAKGSPPHQVFLEIARSLRPEKAVTSKPRKGLFAALF
jgi:pilus assembly protein CpaE